MLGRSAVLKLHSESRRGARRRGIEYSLTLRDIQRLVDRAQGRCEVTGLPFSQEKLGRTSRPFIASLDRIDSTLGYHPGNMRLVCHCVNRAMNDWGEQVLFIMVSALISRYAENDHVEEERPEGRPREVGREAGG